MHAFWFRLKKSVEALMLYLAVLRAGLVYVPLNTAYQSAEMAYFIGNAEPAVVVCSAQNFGWVSKLAFQAGTAWVFTLNDDRTGSLLQRAAHGSDAHTPVPRHADQVAVIIYTSGTTGRSKGAMLTHGNMLSNARVLKDYWGWRSPAQGGDVLIHALPIFHVHGLFVAIHGALLNGSKMLWCARFDPHWVIAKLGAGDGFYGGADLVCAAARRPGPEFGGRQVDAFVCIWLRAIADGHIQAMAAAHGPYDP
jgi:malonyl-CoA/methylmalonyl-CoA synthetase